MNKLTIAVVLLTFINSGSSILFPSVFDAYSNQQANIQSFENNEWSNLIQSSLNYPALANQTRLMYAVNITLIPLLVPANKRADHAEAMSLSCVLVFKSAYQMITELLDDPIHDQNDTTMNSQLAAAKAKILVLQTQCLSNLGLYFVAGPVLKVYNAFQGLSTMIAAL